MKIWFENKAAALNEVTTELRNMITDFEGQLAAAQVGVEAQVSLMNNDEPPMLTYAKHEGSWGVFVMWPSMSPRRAASAGRKTVIQAVHALPRLCAAIEVQVDTLYLQATSLKARPAGAADGREGG